MSGMRQMIPPGAGLVQAAGALGSGRRRAGTYPYQWLFPGPNSRQVRVDGSIVMPADFGAAPIFTYTVPEGMRFVLKGVVFSSQCPNWTQGSGDLLFSLVVTGVGARNVDWLSNVATPLGSFAAPFPITGRLEFTSLTTIEVDVNPVQNVSLGADGGIQSAMLVGWLYPNSEAGEG